jgi:hypothetical protein
MATTEALAQMLELSLHSHKEIGFKLSEAILFGINISDDQLDIVEACRDSDVYELLEGKGCADLLMANSHIALVTTGWAAPKDNDDDDDNDVAPSKHPKRRRVRLTLVADRASTASVLRFEDTPDETVTDSGEAYGSLADAIHKAVWRKPSSHLIPKGDTNEQA